jgi:hypothetical protein
MSTGELDIRVPIGTFLATDARRRQLTGVLFSEGATPLYIHLRDGMVIAIESWDPVWALPALAVSTGLITVEQYRAIRVTQLDTHGRFLDLLLAATSVDRSQVIRLYEAFAYLTLLRLIREAGEFSMIGGAVTADPILIEAISPERFAERLVPLVEKGKTRRILELWERSLVIADPACGLENGPISAGCIASSKRFSDYIEQVEKAVADKSAQLTRTVAVSPIFTATLIFLLFTLFFYAMILLSSGPNETARSERHTADHQIELLRERLDSAVRTLDRSLRKR